MVKFVFVAALLALLFGIFLKDAGPIEPFTQRLLAAVGVVLATLLAAIVLGREYVKQTLTDLLRWLTKRNTQTTNWFAIIFVSVLVIAFAIAVAVLLIKTSSSPVYMASIPAMVVKVSFRRKKNSKNGTIETYTSTRLGTRLAVAASGGRKTSHSQRKHIAYISKSDISFDGSLSEDAKTKIQGKAKQVMSKIVGHEVDVSIDWINAQQKLREQLEIPGFDRKQVVHNREIGKAQIDAWSISDDGNSIFNFANARFKVGALNRNQFIERYYELTSNHSDPEFERWIVEDAAPRLVLSFYKKVRESTRSGNENRVFNRDQFLVFLNAYLKSFAALEFKRVRNRI